jgi:uncharacterized protein (TIGR03435 family)
MRGFSNVSLKDVVGFAFGMRMQQIVAPEWLGAVRFEIVGTLPDTFKPADMPAMLQGLLKDRFKMRATARSVSSRSMASKSPAAGPRCRSRKNRR